MAQEEAVPLNDWEIIGYLCKFVTIMSVYNFMDIIIIATASDFKKEAAYL